MQDAYFTAVSGSGVRPPDFVTGIVFAEFGLFTLFGLVQLVWLYSADTDRDARQERRFIWLSLVAKTLLAWVVLGPAIAASKA